MPRRASTSCLRRSRDEIRGDDMNMKKPDPIQPAHCAQQLSALAAPERIKIVRFLRNGRHNVTEIAAMLKAPPVNVSHHMAVLRQVGIVQGHKEGRFVYYALAPGFIQ